MNEPLEDKHLDDEYAAFGKNIKDTRLTSSLRIAQQKMVLQRVTVDSLALSERFFSADGPIDVLAERVEQLKTRLNALEIQSKTSSDLSRTLLEGKAKWLAVAKSDSFTHKPQDLFANVIEHINALKRLQLEKEADQFTMRESIDKWKSKVFELKKRMADVCADENCITGDVLSDLVDERSRYEMENIDLERQVDRLEQDRLGLLDDLRGFEERRAIMERSCLEMDMLRKRISQRISGLMETRRDLLDRESFFRVDRKCLESVFIEGQKADMERVFRARYVQMKKDCERELDRLRCERRRLVSEARALDEQMKSEGVSDAEKILRMRFMSVEQNLGELEERVEGMSELFEEQDKQFGS